MKANVYVKGETCPVLLGSFSLDGRTGETNFLSEVDAGLKTFLNETLCDTFRDTGLRALTNNGDFWSSFKETDGVSKDTVAYGRLSEMVISASPDDPGETHIVWPETPAVTETGVKLHHIGVDVYNEGYIIGSSAKSANVLGAVSNVYFDKITSKHFKQTGRKYARLFKDEKALLKYLSGHKEVFSQMNSRNGYTFHYEKASSLWEHEPDQTAIKKLDALLAVINSSEEQVHEPVYADDPKTEALFRMQELELHKPVLTDFAKNGKIYMSEFGGMIYDLDEFAEEAVRQTRRKDLLPYHVIHNESAYGDMYAVLFVSEYRDEWQYEHLNPRLGSITAYVYNVSYDEAEIGDIFVIKANGGLVRTDC